MASRTDDMKDTRDHEDGSNNKDSNSKQEDQNQETKIEELEIPDKKYWKFLRKTYLKVKGSTDKTYDRDVKDYAKEYGPCGAQIKFEIRTAGPTKGRGVFALEHVKKGRRVWDTELCGRFLSRQQFEDFLAALPHNMQRDVISWAYVVNQSEGEDSSTGSETETYISEEDGGGEQVNKEKEQEEDLKQLLTSPSGGPKDASDGHQQQQKKKEVLRVYLDLDAGSLINHGGTDVSDYEGWFEEEDLDDDGKKSKLAECLKPDNIMEVTRKQYLDTRQQKVEDEQSDSDSDSDSDSEEEDDDEEYIVAKVDIFPGDELLIDYSRFHDYKNCDEDNPDAKTSWFEGMYDRIMKRNEYYY
mmetsp:Transcript_8519/g.21286  ORF Transcript_8519/g.21286 Transcript_8519/m.21286 type:complete len:356 (-) Transcript_8519:30-1097(-)